MSRIPQDDQRRKGAPMYRGLLGYFPAALFEIAEHSRESNDKHNPGEELHWARGKSSDHEDCIVRHLIDAGKRSVHSNERLYHLRALAWRALALLQEECEALGATPGVSAKFPQPEPTKERLEGIVTNLKNVVVRTPGGAHVLVSHPAQHLAVEAFKAEQARPSNVLADAYIAAAEKKDLGVQLAEAGYDRFASLKGGPDDQ